MRTEASASPIGVCLCVCVYLILLPVPSGACVRACPAAAQCEFLPAHPQPPHARTHAHTHIQFSLCSRSRVDCFNILLIGRLSASENTKTRGRKRQRKRHKRALIVARPLGFLPDSRPLRCEKHNRLSSIIKTAGLHTLSHPYTHTHWGGSCRGFLSLIHSSKKHTQLSFWFFGEIQFSACMVFFFHAVTNAA